MRTPDQLLFTLHGHKLYCRDFEYVITQPVHKRTEQKLAGEIDLIMALSITYRWVLVGNLVIKNEKKAHEDAPKFPLDEIITIAKERFEKNERREYGGKKSKLMWLSNITETDNYYKFLVETADQNTTGLSLLNFDTRKTRDIPKEDNEGSHYTSHIIIRKNPDEFGHYLILIEKVPGITLCTLKDYLRWMCNEDSFKKEHQTEDGKKYSYRPIFDINGHQSSTIREALKTGKLQDIEFIGYEENDEGLDEEGYVTEKIYKEDWVVKQKIPENEAEGLLNEAKEKFLNIFSKKVIDPNMFVRIKTSAGQIKKTAIQVDEESVLEQAFVQNEIINDFDVPLTQRCTELRKDVLKKMKKIIKDKIKNSES